MAFPGLNQLAMSVCSAVLGDCSSPGPPPDRLPLLRRVNRRCCHGVRGRPAGLVPANLAFVLSHHVPPPVAADKGMYFIWELWS